MSSPSCGDTAVYLPPLTLGHVIGHVIGHHAMTVM